MGFPCKYPLFVAVLLAFVLSAPAAARPAAPRPQLRNLVRTFGGIRAFAQDRDTVAWAASQVDRYRVRAKNLATGRSVILGDAGGYRLWLRPPTLAVAGTHVLWTKSWFGTQMYVDLRTATIEQESGRRYVRPTWLLETAQGTECGEDGYFAGAAGDGATLVWAWTVFGPRAGCGENGYDRDVVGGGVVPVKPPLPPGPNESAHDPIGGIPAAAPAYSNTGEQKQARQLAVSQGRIAVAGQYWWGFPAVAERAGRGAHRRRRARLPGLPGRDGPSDRALVAAPGSARAATRRLAGDRALRRERRPRGDDAGRDDRDRREHRDRRIVYRVGRIIYTVRRSKPALLWRAKATPIGLSVEGRRVAWAVNLHGSGLIVALTLPR